VTQVLIWVSWFAFAALALVILELVARAWIRSRGEYAVWRPGARLHMHTDRAILPSQEELVRFEINSEGERGDEPPRDPEGTYRILVAGGSAAECYFLDQPSTWPEVMKRELSTPERLAAIGARRIHVGSIGKSLVSAETIDQVFARVLPRYRKLDVLILMVGASNVANWLGKGAPPRIEEKPAVPPQVFDVHPEGTFEWRPGKMALAELARRLRSRFIRPVEVRHGAGARLGKAREMRRNATKILTEIPDPAVMVDHFERRFRDMLRAVGKRVPRIVIVRQPWFRKDGYTADELATFWHGAAGNPYAGPVTTYYSYEIVSRLVDLVDRRVAQVADDLGIQHVDLMPRLEPSLRTFYDFWHFTPAGAAVVGKAVAESVLEPARAAPVAGARSSLG
jgi:hypothetical protein